MGRRTVAAVALGVTIALSAVGLASAEKPVIVEAVTSPPLTINGGLTPKALPKKAFAPVVLDVSAKVQAQSGALRELVLDLDRNILIDIRGFPVCTGGRLDIRTNHFPEACRDALLGKGSVTVLVAFPEQAPIPTMTRSFVINGGQKGATATLYVLSYLTQPIMTAIITTVKTTRERRGRFGTRAVVTIPIIAGGAGSVTDLHLVLNRGLKVEGEPFSTINAKCPDGHLSARATAVFSDATEAEAEFTRTCVGES